MDNRAENNSQLSKGAIAGIVVGILAFITIKSVIVYWVCRAKRRRISRQPARRLSRDEETRAFLRQLKAHEFACHDTKICVDRNGQQVILGKGGFGYVLLGARNENQPVAIKQMLNPDRKAKMEFLKEINLLKRVSLDSNIVQYFGACFAEDELWLVTEYMEGGDLRKALASMEGERLNWWTGGKQIAMDVARGLSFLHNRNVIHGDLKSQNILLTSEGKAKIADVGMSQIVSDRPGRIERGKQGTLAWAAPELLDHNSRITEKVDIFSFGACLWEIVTSHIPQRGILFTPSADACPSGIISLIADCMKEEPQGRPSAMEVYSRLVACEPYHPDFGGILDSTGLLDSAEGGGRRSQGASRGGQTGQYPPKRRIPGIRRSLQAFMAETPAFEQEEPAPQDHVAIEMTEPPRRSQEPRGNTRQAGNIDEKVEFKSQSPRYYRPESPQPESNSQGQPRGWRDAPPAKSRKTLPTLPSSNIALEQLVAKWTPRPKPDINRLGAIADIEDTAILTSVDADLNHIPSLHNTMDGEVEPHVAEACEISMDSKDTEAINAWLEPGQDIFGTPSQEAANALSSQEEEANAARGSSQEGGTEVGTDDELESAAVESVQGYAGSESSSMSKTQEGTASQRRLPVHSSLASSERESLEYEADLTSHHLDVTEANVAPASSGSYESFFSTGRTPTAGNTSMDGQATSIADDVSQRTLRQGPSASQQGAGVRAWWHSSSNTSDWEDDTSLSLYSADSFRVLSQH